MDLSLLQIIGSLGVGGVLGVVIFLMYRQDRKSSEDRTRQDRVFMEDNLRQIIDRDQSSREDNTKVVQELITLLRRINGGKHG